MAKVISADSALNMLKQGNARFITGQASPVHEAWQKSRKELLQGQVPFAIVLGCSDSRVPVELVFDQGFGELFVIRVAGNIVAPSQIGSIEFAAEQFGARLVVVLGHSGCGAVHAALQSGLGHPSKHSPNINFIINRIAPNITVHSTSADTTSPVVVSPQLLSKAVRANVLASVAQIQEGSKVIERLISEEGLQVIGAEYSLESGKVEFLK